MTTLSAVSWPLARAAEALEALARDAGIEVRDRDAPRKPADLRAGSVELDIWLEQTGSWLGFEVEATETAYPDVAVMLQQAAPSLIAVTDGEQTSLLAVVGGSRRQLTLLAPDLQRRKVPLETVRAGVCREVETPVLAECEAVLERAHLSGRRRQRSLAALLDARLRFTMVARCWMVRLLPSAPVADQLRGLRVRRRIGALVGVHALQYALWILAWWVIGRGALGGHIDTGWLIAWVILLMSIVPLRLLTTWWSGCLAIDTGAFVKQRLITGALRVDPDSLRDEGVGQLLGRVLESDAVEMMALSGGFSTLFSAVELALASVVLGLGAGGPLHALLLIAWVALTLMLTRRYIRQRAAWTDTRLAMTHELVEAMVGHETRLAQSRPDLLHDDEDRALVRYVNESRRMDRTMVTLAALIPRGWLLLGVAGLLPAFLAGDGAMVALAIGLGGVLLAYRALRGMVEGLTHLSAAAISWRKVEPIFHAAEAGVESAPPITASEIAAGSNVAAVRATDISFVYRGRTKPVLHSCDVEIQRGERVLLEGPSGSGKSTLGAIIAGVREPSSGLLMVGGLDRHTLGAEGWRQHVVCAPQFHENHVFSGTLLFNVLMGRRWPPPQADVGEAEQLCRRLGLGVVLDRMPGGMFQLVGETGWQLSHGERSRVFIARALLQRAPVVVLDESLAALDPDNLALVLDVINQAADTLLVIAHP